MKASNNFNDLVELIKILRKECPWDRKQTHESLKDHLIEEAYETIEAIDNNDFDELKKELGDVLLQVVFHSIMGEEKKQFDMGDVIQTIQQKMIRRHPHVFDDANADDAMQVSKNWESIKMKEGKESVLEGIPRQLPALIRAHRMQQKAANVGFDWPEKEQVWEKLEEELGEFKDTLEGADRNRQQEEFGDLLFSLVNIGRSYGLMSEDSLRATNKKFTRRFQHIERQLQQNGQDITDSSLEEMDRYWEEAKKQHNQ